MTEITRARLKSSFRLCSDQIDQPASCVKPPGCSAEAADLQVAIGEAVD